MQLHYREEARYRDERWSKLEPALNLCVISPSCEFQIVFLAFCGFTSMSQCARLGG